MSTNQINKCSSCWTTVVVDKQGNWRHCTHASTGAGASDYNSEWLALRNPTKFLCVPPSLVASKRTSGLCGACLSLRQYITWEDGLRKSIYTPHARYKDPPIPIPGRSSWSHGLCQSRSEFLSMLPLQLATALDCSLKRTSEIWDESTYSWADVVQKGN